MLSLAGAALFFIAIHLGFSGTSLRDRAVQAIGLRGYMLAFTGLSVLGMVWLVMAYNTAPYAETWGMLQGWKGAAVALMLPAFLLVTIGLTTPNPTAAGQEGRVAEAPRGIVRITRHPFLVGVALWSLVHLIGNGNWSALLFFGALFVVAAAGTVSIDAKRRRTLGPAAWDGFAARTSILPFVAILAGRNTLSWSELGWWRPALGVVLFALMLGGHVHLFGVVPYPR